MLGMTPTSLGPYFDTNLIVQCAIPTSIVLLPIAGFAIWSTYDLLYDQHCKVEVVSALLRSVRFFGGRCTSTEVTVNFFFFSYFRNLGEWQALKFYFWSITATVTSLKIPVITFLQFSFAVCVVSLKGIYNIQTFLVIEVFGVFFGIIKHPV